MLRGKTNPKKTIVNKYLKNRMKYSIEKMVNMKTMMSFLKFLPLFLLGSVLAFLFLKISYFQRLLRLDGEGRLSHGYAVPRLQNSYGGKSGGRIKRNGLDQDFTFSAKK